MSRIDYSRNYRRNSPIKPRQQRSRSRERYSSSRRSPSFSRRLPVHQRLSDQRSRSIEKGIGYPTKYELERRQSKRSTSRRRRRSSSKSSRRSRATSRSRSPRRKSSRSIRSRSRSRERDREREKFTYISDYNLAAESNEICLNKPISEEYIRTFNFNDNLTSNSNYFLSADKQQIILEKPVLLEKQPLIDKPPLIYDNQFLDDKKRFNDFYNENDYFDNQLNQLKTNNHHQFLNQIIPESIVDSLHSNAPVSRSIRDRLDVIYPTTSSSNAPLLETPSNFLNNSSLNSNSNCSLINNSLTNLNSPLNLNSNASNLQQQNNFNNELDNGFFNRNQDTDLRNSNNNLMFKDSLLGNGLSDHHQQNLNSQLMNSQKNLSSQLMSNQQDGLEKCMFSQSGCPILMNKDAIGKHILECLYNPKNVKAFCNKCKLTVCTDHDCIQELRNELIQTRIKTNWCQKVIKLSNTSLLNSDLNEQVISIHYIAEKEIVKQIKINKNERMDFVLKQAVDLIFTKESLIRQNKTDRDFQLICTGLYTFLPEIAFSKSMKLQLPIQDDDQLHLVLIEKKLTVKVAVKRLFYENQHIIVSVPTAVPFSIDPTKRISDLKGLIGEKMPIIWEKHRLSINGKEYKDYQILYAIGLTNGDRVEIEAF